jgi:5-dehydro-2-deoxygluconokinase
MDDTVFLEVLTVGRSSVDLYGEQVGGRLEDMGSFAKYVGGSPTNTAVGAARLGLRAGLLTRVGDDHMGRFIREKLTREGVDTRGVLTDPKRLTALVILGIRDRENFPLIFYRENCADMALCRDDLDPALIKSAAAVLINGTHLSTRGVFEASLSAAKQVKAQGGRVVFDVDYRPVLWGLTGRDAGENRFVASESVTEQLRTVVPLCDLIVGTEEEIHILGGSTDTLEALRAVRSETEALIVCKRGPLGCVAFPGPIPDTVEGGVSGPGFKVEVFNVLGAGDAFMAGFLRGWLRGEALERCCELGNACGAIVVSRHGCAPAMPTSEELDLFLRSQPTPVQLRTHAMLDHVHWATTRTNQYDELTVLAIDHRSQFEDLIEETGASADRVPAFKALALRALDQVAAGDPRFGVLLDGRYGFDALAQAAATPYWIGRPIELPKSRPLEFEGSRDVAAEIASWPLNHVVKCLVFTHPDDPRELQDRQERQLLRLFDACRATRHELLIEVIAPNERTLDEHTISRAMERLYEVGVKPDWWKLEPTREAATWRNIEAVIARHDPYCRGVVLLGLSAPIPDLIASFDAAAPVPIIKGFAVGRTIFAEAARDWLTGVIDDEEAVNDMASRLALLVKAWRACRHKVEQAA